MDVTSQNDTDAEMNHEIGMLYESIFTRKSCRSYDMTPLSEEELSNLLGKIATFKTLDPNVKLSIQVAHSIDVRGVFKAEAPHYLIISGTGAKREAINAGFLFEQWTLYASAQGYGCVWLGATRPKSENNGAKTIVVIAFGRTNEPHTRTYDEFDRKVLADIAVGETPLLEPARLAPSAMNGQPWRFIVATTEYQEEPVIYIYKKRSFAQLFDDHSDLDMGIMLSHLYIAYLNAGLPFVFSQDSKSAPKPPSGCTYFGTLQSM